MSSRLSRETKALSDVIVKTQAKSRTLEVEISAMRPALSRQGQALAQLQGKLLTEKSEVSRLRTRNLALASGQKDLKRSFKDIVVVTKRAQAKVSAEAQNARREAQHWQSRYAQVKEVITIADVMLAETLDMFQRVNFDSVSLLAKWTRSAMERIRTALSNAMDQIGDILPGRKIDPGFDFAEQNPKQNDGYTNSGLRKNCGEAIRDAGRLHGQHRSKTVLEEPERSRDAEATHTTGSAQSTQSAPLLFPKPGQSANLERERSTMETGRPDTVKSQISTGFQPKSEGCKSV